MKNVILLMTTIFTLNACEVSPLLNHENADDKKNNGLNVANENCPLDFPNSGLCAKIEWIVGPSGDGENSFFVKFWGKETGTPQGPFVDPEHDDGVQLWMPSMGHGSSPVTVTEEEVGVFRATRVFFIMPGPWDIRVKLLDGATLVEQAIQSLTIR